MPAHAGLSSYERPPLPRHAPDGESSRLRRIAILCCITIFAASRLCPYCRRRHCTEYHKLTHHPSTGHRPHRLTTPTPPCRILDTPHHHRQHIFHAGSAITTLHPSRRPTTQTIDAHRRAPNAQRAHPAGQDAEPKQRRRTARRIGLGAMVRFDHPLCVKLASA